MTFSHPANGQDQYCVQQDGPMRHSCIIVQQPNPEKRKQSRQPTTATKSNQTQCRRGANGTWPRASKTSKLQHKSTTNCRQKCASRTRNRENETAILHQSINNVPYLILDVENAGSSWTGNDKTVQVRQARGWEWAAPGKTGRDARRSSIVSPATFVTKARQL